ncbi:MAG: hypothetical protein ABIP48_03515, partial [Planctomycetota bacterium]
DDLDAAAPELQYNVIASTIDVQSGNICSLTVGSRAAVDITVGDNVAEFSSTSLPQSDSLTLRVSCTNNAGTTCEDQVTVSVELGDCVLAIAPASTTFNLQTVDDDPNTNGLQKNLTVTTDCPDGSDVTLTVNGAGVQTAQTANFETSFLVTLPEDVDNTPVGPSPVEASLASTDDRSGHDIATYSVDLQAPIVEITSPWDGQLLGPGYDQDISTSDLLDLNIAGKVSGGVSGTTISLYIDSSPNSHATYVMTAEDATEDPFNFTFSLVPFAEGMHDIKATADDQAGNLGSDEISFAAALAQPAIAFTDPDPAGDPALLGCGDDTNTNTDELQYLVCADTENVPAGDNATLSIDNGQAIQGTVTAPGEVGFLIALDDGDHTLQACAQVTGFDETCGPLRNLSVDWTAPVIAIESHLDGQRINTPTFDLVGSVTGAPDGADIALSIDGGAAVTVQISGGGFVFPGVTFADETTYHLDVSLDLNNGSDADGAAAKGCSASASISLTLDTTLPTVDLTLHTATGDEPADGAALVEADDLDGDCENGFQVDVLVQTTGVPEGTEVRLWIGTAQYFANTDAGLATFSSVLLAQGANVLTARTTDLAGNEGMGSASLTTDCGCPISVITPGPDARLSLADDVDAVTDGVQIDILADTDTAAGVIATLYLNEGKGAPCELPAQNQVTDANGDATFAAVGMCAGDNTIRITTNDAGKICTIANHDVNVKIGKPSIAFANLTDGQYLNKASVDASGAAGFQYDITVTTIDAEDGSIAKLTVAGGTAIEATVAGDAATFQDMTLCTQVPCASASPLLEA